MKISIGFTNPIKGEAPRVSPRLLPAEMAQAAVSAKLMSGDLEAYNDLSGELVLAKSAPINTISKLTTGEWLQWSQSELNSGFVNVDATLGPIPGDTSQRVFFTGVEGKPRWTNHYYATDPSQQGAHPLAAYPYTDFPLGVEGPTAAPTAVAAPSSAAYPTSTWQYAAPTSVNSGVVNEPGMFYAVGDTVNILGGTVQSGLTGAQFSVTSVDSSGAITGIELLSGGFYTYNDGPGTTAAPSSTSGSGTGALFDLTLVAFPAFGSWTPVSIYNGAYHLAYSQWAVNTPASATDYFPWRLNAAHRLGTASLAKTFAYSSDTYGLSLCYSFDVQFDTHTEASRGTNTAPALWLAGNYQPADTIGTGYPGMQAAFVAFCNVAGTEFANPDTFALYDETHTILHSVAVAYTLGTVYRIKVHGVATTSASLPGFQITATLVDAASPNTVLATVSGFIKYFGDKFAFGVVNVPDDQDSEAVGSFANVQVIVTQPPTSALITEYVNYVITYNQQYQLDASDTFFQESRPSDPSNTVVAVNESTNAVPSWGAVDVSWPAPPADITTISVYRSSTAADGTTAYLLVKDKIPAGTTTFHDTVLPADLGEELITTGFDPPLTDMRGILALPNGIMAGFSKNQLCLSAQNYPYGWPVGYQYNTDSQIVAIAAIDSTILILTQSHPYTAWGNTPDAFSMSKEEFVLGCASKRSVSYLRGIGVVYASAEGIVAYAGQGRQAKLTENLFTREQWQSYAPSSIIGTVHDGKYYFWYDNGITKGGFVLDTDPNGFGLIELDFHVTATFVDPLTDILYFCLDDGSALPANEVQSWDSAATLRPYRWRSKKFLLPYPSEMAAAQIKAFDYTDLTFKIFVDGAEILSKTVLSEAEFVVPSTVGRTFEVEVSGTSRVNQIEVAQSMEELT